MYNHEFEKVRKLMKTGGYLLIPFVVLFLWSSSAMIVGYVSEIFNYTEYIKGIAIINVLTFIPWLVLFAPIVILLYGQHELSIDPIVARKIIIFGLLYSGGLAIVSGVSIVVGIINSTSALYRITIISFFLLLVSLGLYAKALLEIDKKTLPDSIELSHDSKLERVVKISDLLITSAGLLTFLIGLSGVIHYLSAGVGLYAGDGILVQTGFGFWIVAIIASLVVAGRLNKKQRPDKCCFVALILALPIGLLCLAVHYIGAWHITKELRNADKKSIYGAWKA